MIAGTERGLGKSVSIPLRILTSRFYLIGSRLLLAQVLPSWILYSAPDWSKIQSGHVVYANYKCCNLIGREQLLTICTSLWLVTGQISVIYYYLTSQLLLWSWGFCLCFSKVLPSEIVIPAYLTASVLPKDKLGDSSIWLYWSRSWHKIAYDKTIQI